MTRPTLHGQEVFIAFPKGKYGQIGDTHRYGMTMAIAHFENSVERINSNNRWLSNEQNLAGYSPWSTLYQLIESYVRTYKLSRQLDEYRKCLHIDYVGLDSEFWYKKAIDVAIQNPQHKAINVVNSLLTNSMGVEVYSPYRIDYKDKVYVESPEISTTNNQ